MTEKMTRFVDSVCKGSARMNTISVYLWMSMGEGGEKSSKKRTIQFTSSLPVSPFQRCYVSSVTAVSEIRLDPGDEGQQSNALTPGTIKPT